ncbi:tetratricopeptide repeat protein [Paenibacillus aceti]|uniref:Tetratricopeptide repeat protein n=1 Tax=Paenibacillus aceti TaxID=1820010 RepID=A0ABQ1VZ83_9BACL|nr:hypothetical protein [Paenibacillus aceti]GGG05047.1 hypothetical protein GCM10010913_28600 [Paenibacillus aceti]
MMFQHMFAEMNEMLDEISKFYPMAQGTQKQELTHKWNLLKNMSDGIIEEWLSFEEKMGSVRENWNEADASSYVLPEMKCDAYEKGEGYYKLLMFSKALEQFKIVVQGYPDSLVGRTYLAMCHLHLQQLSEAASHFTAVLERATSSRLRSIIYNALGCIEAQRGKRLKAKEYFALAHQSDPTLPEPLANLQACDHSSGKLKFGDELSPLM